MPRTLAELAQEAMDCQNASQINVVHAMSRSLTDLREALKLANLPGDSDTVNQHPIMKLWASKVHDITRMGLSDCDRYAEAYTACCKLAEG